MTTGYKLVGQFTHPAPRTAAMDNVTLRFGWNVVRRMGTQQYPSSRDCDLLLLVDTEVHDKCQVYQHDSASC